MKYFKDTGEYVYMKAYLLKDKLVTYSGPYKKRPIYNEDERIYKNTVYEFTEKDFQNYIKEHNLSPAHRTVAFNEMLKADFGSPKPPYEWCNDFDIFFNYPKENPTGIWKFCIQAQNPLDYSEADIKRFNRRKKAKADKEFFNLFAKKSVEEIIYKYGLCFDGEGNLVINSEINDIIRDFLMNTLVKELANIGVELNLRKTIISDEGKIRKLALSNQIKLNLGGRNEREVNK